MFERIIAGKDFDQFCADFLHRKLRNLEETKRKTINVALSGGTTPLPILYILKDLNIQWERFSFFIVDERNVSASDPTSNYGNIHKAFFKFIASENFSMVEPGNSNTSSIENYSNTILNRLLINETGFPVFDLILLGLGNDGHTASLFPETEGLLEEQKIAIVNHVPKMDTVRFTLTYPVILNAREIVVLAKGEEKRKIIEEIYSGNSKNYPMLKIAEKHLNLTWLTNK